MPNREKVKKGLECLARKQEPMANPCSKCDYHDRPNFAFCVVDVATDALELLKEQENDIHHMGLIIDEYEKELKEQEAVVRCMDCKHSARCEIAFGCNGNREWYCADGERAE